MATNRSPINGRYEVSQGILKETCPIQSRLKPTYLPTWPVITWLNWLSPIHLAFLRPRSANPGDTGGRLTSNSWDTPRGDLDLHLIEEGGSFFKRPGDCNFCNPNPKWVGPALTMIRVSIWMTSGYGPENINLKTPDSGEYAVKVHYFDDQGESSVVATVRIYTYTVLANELTRVMQRNDIWDVAQVNWPAGTVNVLSTESYADIRSCSKRQFLITTFAIGFIVLQLTRSGKDVVQSPNWGPDSSMSRCRIIGEPGRKKGLVACSSAMVDGTVHSPRARRVQTSRIVRPAHRCWARQTKRTVGYLRCIRAHSIRGCHPKLREAHQTLKHFRRWTIKEVSTPPVNNVAAKQHIAKQIRDMTVQMSFGQQDLPFNSTNFDDVTLRHRFGKSGHGCQLC